jgi:hypothetical protein
VCEFIGFFDKSEALVAHFQNVVSLLRGKRDGVGLDLLDDRIDLPGDLLQHFRGDDDLVTIVHGILLV